MDEKEKLEAFCETEEIDLTGYIVDFLDSRRFNWEEILQHANEEHVGLVGTSLFCLYCGMDGNIIEKDEV